MKKIFKSLLLLSFISYGVVNSCNAQSFEKYLSQPTRVDLQIEKGKVNLEVKGNAQIGSISLENPMIRFAEIFNHVNIRREIFHKFAITFDQKNRRLMIES